tara:strand:- start:653 stop:1207 length:555 start_codon:yes stop_codon:yes gene_type:complete
VKYWWAWLLLIVSLSLEWYFLRLWLERKHYGRFDQLIIDAAETHSLDPSLVKAVIWKESRFNSFATGKAGEIGLMQLTEAAAWEWADATGISNFNTNHLYHPSTNMLAGCFYLAKMIRLFPNCDDPIPFALASYNAGRSQALRWGHGLARTNAGQFIENIGFPSTKNYVNSILAERNRFEPDFN